MVSLSNLKPAKGAIKKRKRIARGPGSNRGNKSTRGMAGAKSRSGHRRKWGFEGGQMPIQKRIPKFGFKNPNKTIFSVVNLETLSRLAQEENINSFDPDVLREHGLISKNQPVKVLAKGELEAAVEVKAHAFSGSARQVIEEKGGKAINL